MAGKTNYTAPDRGMIPDGPAQDLAIYEHFDAVISETVPTVLALPPAGENWPFREIWVTATKSKFWWDAATAGWRPLTPIRGTYNAVTNADGLMTVTHNWGVVPASIQITMRGDLMNAEYEPNARLMEAVIWEKQANFFRARNLRRDSNTWHPDTVNPIAFDWVAFA